MLTDLFEAIDIFEVITPHHRLRLGVGVGIITRLRRGAGGRTSRASLLSMRIKSYITGLLGEKMSAPAAEGTGAGGNGVCNRSIYEVVVRIGAG